MLRGKPPRRRDPRLAELAGQSAQAIQPEADKPGVAGQALTTNTRACWLLRLGFIGVESGAGTPFEEPDRQRRLAGTTPAPTSYLNRRSAVQPARTGSLGARREYLRGNHSMTVTERLKPTGYLLPLPEERARNCWQKPKRKRMASCGAGRPAHRGDIGITALPSSTTWKDTRIAGGT